LRVFPAIISTCRSCASLDGDRYVDSKLCNSSVDLLGLNTCWAT